MIPNQIVEVAHLQIFIASSVDQVQQQWQIWILAMINLTHYLFVGMDVIMIQLGQQYKHIILMILFRHQQLKLHLLTQQVFALE